uniref:polyhomeotic-like protein 3 isoform X2 n=1 Tax=Myxine glutinosa TaxID=7769 RepID=UPI00358E4685
MEGEQAPVASPGRSQSPPSPGTLRVPSGTGGSASPNTQLSVYDRQAVQVLQQALQRQPSTAAQYLQHMYVAQQQHLLLHTAALHQPQLPPQNTQHAPGSQHAQSTTSQLSSTQLPQLTSSQLQQLASVQQINLTSASPQLLGRGQGGGSTVGSVPAGGPAPPAVLLGGQGAGSSPNHMYLQAAQMLIFAPPATVATLPEVTMATTGSSSSQQVQNLALRGTTGPVTQSVPLRPSSQPRSPGTARPPPHPISPKGVHGTEEGWRRGEGGSPPDARAASSPRTPIPATISGAVSASQQQSLPSLTLPTIQSKPHIGPSVAPQVQHRQATGPTTPTRPSASHAIPPTSRPTTPQHHSPSVPRSPTQPPPPRPLVPPRSPTQVHPQFLGQPPTRSPTQPHPPSSPSRSPTQTHTLPAILARSPSHTYPHGFSRSPTQQHAPSGAQHLHSTSTGQHQPAANLCSAPGRSTLHLPTPSQPKPQIMPLALVQPNQASANLPSTKSPPPFSLPLGAPVIPTSYQSQSELGSPSMTMQASRPSSTSAGRLRTSRATGDGIAMACVAELQPPRLQPQQHLGVDIAAGYIRPPPQTVAMNLQVQSSTQRVAGMAAKVELQTAVLQQEVGISKNHLAGCSLERRSPPGTPTPPPPPLSPVEQSESHSSPDKSKAPRINCQEAADVMETEPVPTLLESGGTAPSGGAWGLRGGSGAEASRPPQAVVKPQILTHVIEGFVIQEGAVPFPVGCSSLLVSQCGRPSAVAKVQGAVAPGGTQGVGSQGTGAMGVVQGSGVRPPPSHPDSSDTDMEELVRTELAEQADMLQCELCGKMDYAFCFGGSKRFCSMACAKRYNVSCTKRVGLFKPDHSRHGWRGQRLGRRGRRRGARHSIVRDLTLSEKIQATTASLSIDATSPSEPANFCSSVLPTLPGLLQPPSSPTSCPSGLGAMTTRRRQSERERESRELRQLGTAEGGVERGVVASGGERGSSGSAVTPASPPSCWSVDQVWEFIRSLPGCQEVAEDFRAQEIDGQALLLLKEDHLMSAMSLKLGPALKICARINSLKEC